MELADTVKRLKNKYREPHEASIFFQPYLMAIDSLAEIKGFGEACRFLGVSGEARGEEGASYPAIPNRGCYKVVL